MTQSIKQIEALTWASSLLEKHRREPYVANVLLAHHLSVDTSDLHMTMNETIPMAIYEQFEHDIKLHVKTGIPAQHMTGESHFYGRVYRVNEHVLIPRYDTEFVVQAVIDYVRTNMAHEQVTIVDVGTGSGVIAITLAMELPNATIYATDISEGAIEVASYNRDVYDVSVTFLHGNYLEPIIKANVRPHIIISNPPYIPFKEKEMLLNTVKNYDPSIALFSGESGLEAYEIITAQVSQLEKLPVVLAYEIGFEQGLSVKRIIQESFPWATPVITKDFQQNDRVVFTKLIKDV